jgi:hypothetical protein
MYQLAVDSHPIDETRLFVDSCTSMVPTADNMKLVGSATKLMRAALNGADLKHLRDFVAKIQDWCADVDDVLATAGQAVIDELGDVSYTILHDAIHRVAQIERDVLLTGYEATLRPAFAG